MAGIHNLRYHLNPLSFRSFEAGFAGPADLWRNFHKKQRPPAGGREGSGCFQPGALRRFRREKSRTRDTGGHGKFFQGLGLDKPIKSRIVCGKSTEFHRFGRVSASLLAGNAQGLIGGIA